MLQYDTPNGVYIIRQKDYSGMKGVWNRLKETNHSHWRGVTIDHYRAEDTIDFFRGVGYRRYLPVKYNPCVEPEEQVTLTTSTGRTHKRDLSYLKKRFQLIEDFFDDYLADNPLEDKVPVPYTSAELRLALAPRVSTQLADCYACLAHLNPKSALYYLQYGLHNTPLHILTEVVGRLTERERQNLVAFGQRRGVVLPSTEGVCILACLEHVRTQLSLMHTLFPNHPSFAWCSRMYLVRNRFIGGPEEVEALLSWPFSLDRDELCFPLEYVAEHVSTAVTSATLLPLTADQLLTLAGLLCPSVVPSARVLPYDIDLCSFPYHSDIIVLLIAKLSEYQDEHLVKLREDLIQFNCSD